MNYWYVLGIEPTKDKNIVREAYFEKLKITNPEEDQEGFKKLRQAYEEALKEIDSKKDEEENEDDSEVGIWIRKIKRIYDKFQLRINTECWEELLRDDVCFALDTREDALIELMKFLMDHFCMPQRIWKVIDNTFDVKENREDLYEHFSKDYIDYVVNRIDYESIINYDLFEIKDNADYDRWIYLYKETRKKVFGNNIENIQKDIDEMISLNIYHPYMDVVYSRVAIYNDKIGEAREKLKVVLEKYPNDLEILSTAAEIEWCDKNYAKSLDYYEKELEIDEKNFNALSGKADCLKELGKYKEAKKIYEKLLIKSRYDDYIRQKLYETDIELIDVYKEELKEKPNDKEITLQLGWILSNNGRYDEAKVVVDKLVVNTDEEEFRQYCDLYGGILDAVKDYDKAFETFDKWEKHIEKQHEKTDDDYRQLAYVYSKKANVLYNEGKSEEAISYLEKSLTLVDGTYRLHYLNKLSRMLNKLKRYKESVDYADESIEIYGNIAEPYVHRAEALYHLNYFKEALDDCFDAIDIYPYYIEPYIIEAKIYSKYRRYDDVLEIAKRVEELEISNYKMSLLKVRALTQKEMYDEAKKEIMLLFESIEKGEISDANDIADVNYTYGILCNNMGDVDEGIKYNNKAIELNSENTEYYYFKAFMYLKKNRFKEAIKIYEDMELVDENKIRPLRLKAEAYANIKEYIEAIDIYKEIKREKPNDKYVNGELYQMYKKINNDEMAKKYLELQLRKYPSAYYYIEKGIMLQNENNSKEAKENYKKALELEGDNKYALNNIAYLYYEEGDYNEAIKYYEEAIENDEELEFYDCLETLIKCCEDIGNIEKALEILDANIPKYNKEKLYDKKYNLLKSQKRYYEMIETYKALLDNDKFGLYTKIRCLKKIAKCYVISEKRSKSKKGREKVFESYKALLDSDKVKLSIINKIECLEEMAKCYIDVGKQNEAIKVYEEILKMTRNNENAYKYLLSAYKSLGAKEEVRRLRKGKLKNILHEIMCFKELIIFIGFVLYLNVAMKLYGMSDIRFIVPAIIFAVYMIIEQYWLKKSKK